MILNVTPPLSMLPGILSYPKSMQQFLFAKHQHPVIKGVLKQIL